MEEMEKQLKLYELNNQNLTTELEASQKKEKKLEEKCKALSKELTAALSPDAPKKIKHSSDFWKEIGNHCTKKTGPFGTDSIKTMIKTGKMTVYDTDPKYGRTLLILAAREGAYELVQFLINNVLC